MEKLHGLYLSATVLVVLVILDASFKQALHDSSAEVTLAIQETSCGVTDWFFKQVDKVSIWFVLLIPLYCLAAEGLKTGLPLLAIACIAGGLSDLLKMTYTDERPYWAYGAIRAIKCTKGFGNPSGHSLLAGAVYGLFAYFCFKREQKKLAWGLLAAVVLVGYDRLFLGVHSYNQVLLGWGLAAAIIAVLLLLKLSKHHNLTAALIGSHGFTLGVLGLCLLLYSYSEPNWDQNWSLYIFEVRNRQKCDLKMNGEKVMWHALTKLPGIFLFPGFMTGLYVAEKYRSGDYKWTSVSLQNAAVRFFFSLFILALTQIFRWAINLVASSAITAFSLGAGVYVGGAVIAYLVPMLKVFPEEGKGELNQKLVQP